MCRVMCDAKTCKNYSEGICNAETISIKNFEYYDSDEKDYKDYEKCTVFQYDKDWMLRPRPILRAI